MDTRLSKIKINRKRSNRSRSLLHKMRRYITQLKKKAKKEKKERYITPTLIPEAIYIYI
jgi:hypothetical protein